MSRACAEINWLIFSIGAINILIDAITIARNNPSIVKIELLLQRRLKLHDILLLWKFYNEQEANLLSALKEYNSGNVVVQHCSTIGLTMGLNK
jgi:hypothetical protein